MHLDMVIFPVGITVINISDRRKRCSRKLSMLVCLQNRELYKSAELRLITSIAQDAMNKFSIEKVSWDSIHEWTLIRTSSD
jgi:hypothetical protein